MDGWSVNTLGHRRPPISSSYPWCNTKLRGGQDFYRSCSLLHLYTCVYGESVPPSPGNLFQTLSCSSRPCSFFHHLLDNLRKQRWDNRQRGKWGKTFWSKCWQYLNWNILTYVTFWDVARLPSFLLVSGVAPDYMVVGARVSAKVVLAHLLVQFVLVRLLVRPLLAF